MKQADIPLNEKKRLHTLQSLGVLDTPNEERFDRITRMAKKMFNAPIAIVSLIDEDRQWFKSCAGIDIKETSREISFCAHTILDSEVLVIPDTSLDQRFFDNPFVIGEANIQFYAGCPLVVNGYRVGAVCISDHQPRDFEQDDIDSLKDLAATVELELSILEIATHDELTGLLNRRGFLSLAQHCLNLSARNRFPVTLAYIDLNEFKHINDNFGHAEGDNILSSFSQLLNSHFRESDILARLAGDEFILLLNYTAQNEAEKVIEKFIGYIDKFHRQQKTLFPVSFSFGLVEFDPEKHHTIEDLLSEGDDNMYHCKKKNS